MKYSDIMQTRYWTPARKFRLVRRTLLAVSLVALMAVRFIPGGGEFYASHLYPAISSALSAVSSLTTYSLEEIYVVLATVMLITYPVIARVRYLKWKHVAITEMEIVLAVYSWFYWGWGLNYFRDSFYERQSVKPAKYDKEAFRSFLKEYTFELNRSEQESAGKRIDRKNIEKDIRDGYNRERDLHGLCEAKDRFEPKETLFNGLYSGVGVSGYMGPFFCEMQINGDLPDEQFAFTYAHELAHMLGVSSEAEANFWAYSMCCMSENAQVKNGGYFGILPYVASSALYLLDEKDFKEWADSIDKRVLEKHKRIREYWAGLYCPTVGAVQDWTYDLFLKGNNVSSGVRNYSEVIGMIMSVREKNNKKE